MENLKIVTNKLEVNGYAFILRLIEFAFQNSIIPEPRLLRGIFIFTFYNRSGIKPHRGEILVAPSFRAGLIKN